MSTQKMKKGFTLIELMVVIVIIGILAAIAIPKLFGMTAKAKAQEVGPAAGTWSKLMAAYTLEKGSMGNWCEISYIAPGGEKISDAADCIAGAAGIQNVNVVSTNFNYDETGIGAWRATTKAAIGSSCEGGKTWVGLFDDDKLMPTWSGDGATATTPCGKLTPNFNDIK